MTKERNQILVAEDGRIREANYTQQEWAIVGIDKIKGASNGEEVGYLGDFLVGTKLREIYKDALYTSVVVSKIGRLRERFSVGKGKHIAGELVNDFGEWEIRVNTNYPNTIEQVLLEEGAHKLRILRDRQMSVSEQKKTRNLSFQQYEDLPDESSAKKLVDFILKQRGKKRIENVQDAVRK